MKTKTAVTHTPTPWSLEGVYFSHYDEKDIPVSIGSTVHQEDAAYIVRAVNSHERLLNLLKQMQSANVFKGIWIQFVEEAIAKAEEHVARWG